MRDIYGDVQEILVTKEQLAEKISELGVRITEDYGEDELIVVGVLKGAGVFMSDLIRHINGPIRTDYMVVSSYGSGTVTSGNVRIIKDMSFDVRDCDILLVEDIVDTGNTLSYLKNYLTVCGAKSVRICTLLDKPSRREKEITVDYRGFEVPDVFIVGYGIDYAERYRNLPYVASLKPEIYEG